MPIRSKSAIAAAVALSLGLALSACGDTPNNRSLYSVKQPVVERSNFSLDLAAGAGGLTVQEQQRLADWFDAMKLRYGDRVAIDGALPNESVRDDIAAIAARHNLLLSEGAPITTGFVQPGMVRVVVTRSRATVPGCPDWSDKFASNLENALHDGFGCAINGNIAAMIADPQHLLEGAEPTDETIMSPSGRAIDSYRSGGRALPAVSSQSGGS